MRVIINGYNGRMGVQIAEALTSFEDMKLVAGIDNRADGTETIPCFNSPFLCNIEADVIIDFSHFSAVEDLLTFAKDKKIPIVIATTALGDKERNAIENAAKIIPVFTSYNMSLGINTIIASLSLLVPPLEKNFDIEIVEKHHNQKKDSPSGTALLLADAVNNNCSLKKEYIFGRHGNADSCSIDQICIHSVRGGTIPGEHTIILAGNDEVIEIKHTALSKEIFAHGAISAAEFIVSKPAGLYSMNDLINTKRLKQEVHNE